MVFSMNPGKESRVISRKNQKDSADYLTVVSLIERLHRNLLDLLKAALEAEEQKEVNNVQALLLYNIADSELTAGELRSLGHYQGSNVSYNLKKLVDAGYIHHERSLSDRRSVRVRLTPRGQRIRAIVGSVLESHLAHLARSNELDEDGLANLAKLLSSLDEFWRSQSPAPA